MHCYIVGNYGFIPIHFQEDQLANIKKVDCSLLPPSQKTLDMKLLRTRYITMLWSNAGKPNPGNGLSPTEYGWCIRDDKLQPLWFKGQAMPDSLLRKKTETSMVSESDDKKTIIGDDNDLQSVDLGASYDTDDEPWSGDSESEVEEDA